MKENEFDIWVRDLMAGAEESVSPDLWKGVEAGLDRAARKRPVPLWLWRGLAGTGIAAAIAAAFFLPRPQQNLSNQPTIQNPVAEATDAPLPAEPRPEEDVVIPIGEQAARIRRHTAHVPEILTPVVTEEEEPLTSEAVVTQPERKPDSIIEPDRHQDAFTSDEEAFRQLAFEEHKTHRRGEFSMSVLGNVQSNTRPRSPGSTIRRTSGMFLPREYKPGINDEKPEFSFGLPVSAGIGLRYDFSPRWGIGTGIVYSNLSRSFLATYADGTGARQPFETDVTNQQHYIGIPVNVFFNIVNSGHWNFHVRLDGMGEKLLDNHFLVHDSEGDIHLHEKATGLQLSTGVGVGVEFKFSPNVGIYFDPTLRYYFDNKQPRSLRTIQPLRMDFEAGLRFSLGR